MKISARDQLKGGTSGSRKVQQLRTSAAATKKRAL